MTPLNPATYRFHLFQQHHHAGTKSLSQGPLEGSCVKGCNHDPFAFSCYKVSHQMVRQQLAPLSTHLLYCTQPVLRHEFPQPIQRLWFFAFAGFPYFSVVHLILFYSGKNPRKVTKRIDNSYSFFLPFSEGIFFFGILPLSLNAFVEYL